MLTVALTEMYILSKMMSRPFLTFFQQKISLKWFSCTNTFDWISLKKKKAKIKLNFQARKKVNVISTQSSKKTSILRQKKNRVFRGHVKMNKDCNNRKYPEVV
jgi:hypothetical protein